jgi:hypothetical protein
MLCPIGKRSGIVGDSKIRRIEMGASEVKNLIIEDDGETVYGYLLDSDDEIVADVWIGNRVEAPIEPPWLSSQNPPFLNPFAKSMLHTELEDFDAIWNCSKDSVEISHNAEVIAVMQIGTKPGWSKLASEDGPLALVLS